MFEGNYAVCEENDCLKGIANLTLTEEEGCDKSLLAMPGSENWQSKQTPRQGAIDPASFPFGL